MFTKITRVLCPSGRSCVAVGPCTSLAVGLVIPSPKVLTILSLFLTGATVGGGSVINWGVCFETPSHVLQEWTDSSGAEIFTSDRYMQAMAEVWGRIGAQRVVAHENFPNAVLRAGCEKMYSEVGTLARNCDPGHSCGWCSYGCPRGEKRTSAATWLQDAAETGNAIVLSECEAHSVLYRANSTGIGAIRFFVSYGFWSFSCLRCSIDNPLIC